MGWRDAYGAFTADDADYCCATMILVQVYNAPKLPHILARSRFAGSLDFRRLAGAVYMAGKCRDAACRVRRPDGILGSRDDFYFNHEFTTNGHEWLARCFAAGL